MPTMNRIDENPALVAALNDLHGRLATACICALVTEPLRLGGNSADTMVILASVVLGVLRATAAMGRDNEADLEQLLANVRGRMGDLKPCTVPGLYGNA